MLCITTCRPILANVNQRTQCSVKTHYVTMNCTFTFAIVAYERSNTKDGVIGYKDYIGLSHFILPSPVNLKVTSACLWSTYKPLATPLIYSM
jgi:hypothetical protein